MNYNNAAVLQNDNSVSKTKETAQLLGGLALATSRFVGVVPTIWSPKRAKKQRFSIDVALLCYFGRNPTKMISKFLTRLTIGSLDYVFSKNAFEIVVTRFDEAVPPHE